MYKYHSSFFYLRLLMIINDYLWLLWWLFMIILWLLIFIIYLFIYRVYFFCLFTIIIIMIY